MRLLMTAGKAAERDNTCGFNCSYLPIDDVKAFDEAMFILLCGTGVGFSVERQYIQKLPEIPEKLFESETTVVVKDSKEGWAKSFRQIISLLYSGEIPKWDVSRIRPAGARLKTFGGRASGPGPLEDLFRFTIAKFKGASGRRLSSLECHDILCKIGEVVVVGGVRRCLPKGSLVHAREGMIPIDRIKIGQDVLTSSGYEKVTNKFYQGVQNLVRIHTQDSWLDCTSNHKIAVLISPDKYIWKQASEILSGDRIISTSTPIEGGLTTLPQWNYVKPKLSTTCKNITIPNLDEDMAWLLGIIQGDGYVASNSKSGSVSIPINKKERVIGEKVEQQLKRFGVNVGVSDYENYYVLRVKSKQLAQYFNSWLKNPKIPLQIPEFIWKSPQEIKLSYVSGLVDADGCIKTRPAQIVCSIYPSFVRKLQLLLQSCGVQTRYKKASITSLKSNWKSKYLLSPINNSSKMILNTFGIKKFSLSKSEQRTNSYPNNWRICRNQNNKVNHPWSKTNYKLIPVEVLKVEQLLDKQETWDLEVENAHEFFCEGYLVHNSAMISLSNLSDDRMRKAKMGQWWETEPQRTLSNNSVAYTEKPDPGAFMEEWMSLYSSKSGERGVFNRIAAKKQAAKNGRRESNYEFGVNPCGEIILRPNSFCNLTESVVRYDDTVETLKRKVRLATILGTFQSTLNHFPYLRKIWRENAEQEYLLGVSLTGIMDNYDLVNGKIDFKELREVAVQTNKEWASLLGISPSAAITTCKPSGTVSQLVDSASGIHPRHSAYYIRSVRADNKDPLTQFMKEAGIPNEPEINKPEQTTVFYFPIKSPDKAILRDDLSAIQQLEFWKRVRNDWTEHNPSITVTVREEEWPRVGGWVYDNFDELCGVSFLPHSDHIYRQAPYQECTEEQYLEAVNKMPKEIKWEDLSWYETEDNTTGVQSLACAADGIGCEVVDIT